MIQSGKAASLSEAARIVGISRSAYYKYRDCVFPYKRDMSSEVATYHFVVKDKTGILSTIISEISATHANILTINQSIPTDGYAPVTITVALDSTNNSDIELLEHIRSLEGVAEARRMSSY